MSVILSFVRVLGLATIGLVAVGLTGCGQRQGNSAAVQRNTTASPSASPSPRAHPQAVEPIAGTGASSDASNAQPDQVSVDSGSATLAQPVSDAEIRRELAASGIGASASQATLTTNGLALAPVNAPASVQQVIAAGNQIAHLPYRFGGGHGTFEDNAYDCSGSLSFVFAAAGILNTTVTSGELMSWGAPGPGKWITVFANNGHTFMYVAGLRFDTVALAQTGTRWSNHSANEPDLGSFVPRHPPGL